MAQEISQSMKTKSFWGVWTLVFLGMGVAIGSIFGTSLNNMPAGIIMGLAIGLILAITFRRRA